MRRHRSKHYDWRSNILKRGWPYSGDVGNPKYEKEKAELFAKHGNGWWWFTSNKINPYKRERGIKIIKKE